MRGRARILLAALLLAATAEGSGQAQPPGNRPGTPAEMRAFRAQLRESEATIRRIARENAVNYDALHQIAEAIGTRLPRIGRAELIRLVYERAGELRMLRARVAGYETERAGGDAGTPLLAAAARALDEGRLDDANHALAQLVALRRQALDQALTGWAAGLKSQAELARLRLDWDLARSLSRSLLDDAPASAVVLRWQGAMGLAEADYQEGGLLGDNRLLARASRIYREQALPLAPRRDRPRDWAATQNNLGNALRLLGDRERSERRLREAIAAFDEALKERTQAADATDWAKTRVNLGNAFLALGDLTHDAAAIENAIKAYRDALTVLTRPIERAAVQNNLGNALTILGRIRRDPAPLLQALAAHQAALADQPRAEARFPWATTQNNLGNTLVQLGVLENSPARFEAAIRAYRLALEARTERESPFDWATTLSNLGSAQQELGLRERGTRRLAEAAVSYRDARRVRRRDSQPVPWALTTENLAQTLHAIAERNADCRAARLSVAEFEGAFTVFESHGVQANQASTGRGLAAARVLRARLCGGE